MGPLVRIAAVAIGGLLLAAMAHRALGPNGYQAYRQRETQKHQLEQDIRQLTIRNIELNGNVQKLSSYDKKTMEDVARQDLKLAKPGEVIYVLPPETPKK